MRSARFLCLGILNLSTYCKNNLLGFINEFIMDFGHSGEFLKLTV